MDRNKIVPLAWERRFWRLVWVIRYPRTWYYDARKWRKRPKAGDRVLAHGEARIVVEVRPGGDGLVLDGGEACSWMNCCDAID
jgi:hypothetical protein